ncbi:unnamed protein product [Symbiodinium microadriaticum]|nr:unnamed protein product [Symbiodinium microadriaticum]
MWHARVREVAPFVYDPEYGVEGPFFRRERYLYMLEFGNTLVATAMDREGVPAVGVDGIADSESLLTRAGQDLPFQSGQSASEEEVKEAFLPLVARLCAEIKVRMVIQIKLEYAAWMESEEASTELRYTKAVFPMSAFGSKKQHMMMLWGSDLLLIRGMKHIATRLLWFKWVANRQVVGFPTRPSFEEVVDVLMLRHRRTVQSLMALHMVRALDGIARDLVKQDLDGCYMVTRRIPEFYCSIRRDMVFEYIVEAFILSLQIQEFYVTRPLGPPTLLAASVPWLNEGWLRIVMLLCPAVAFRFVLVFAFLREQFVLWCSGVETDAIAEEADTSVMDALGEEWEILGEGGDGLA